MKRPSFKRKIQAYHLRSGLFAFAVCFFLASTSLVQAADTRIAFMSTRSDHNGEIFLMNLDGKRVRRLTRHPEYDAVPAWSPDGQKIAFMSFRDEPRDIYVMNSDGTNLINLTQSPERSDSHPSWSPDGNQIAFSSNRDGNREVYVMNADGTNPINLTNHPARDGGADWSPDGMRIAFSTNRDGNWEKKPNDNWEVYVMNADGTNPINLTNHPAWDSQASWEPVPTLSVSPKGGLVTLWGKVKRANTFNGK